MAISFSMFTPTYNRCKDLPGVYHSLQIQTYRNFEWVVVDDGSNDGTRELIESYMKEADFPIKYEYQENQGKHIAQNKAIDMAEGELFLPLDSDDTMVAEALEVLWTTWMGLTEEERKNYSGVGCHCKDQNGKRVGTPWPKDGIISNDIEMYFKYKIRGEKWGPIRTDIMKNFKNAEVKGHFLSENVIWFQIADRYQKIYIDKCLRIYEVHADSVTTKMKTEKDFNFESSLYSDCFYLNNYYNWYLRYSMKEAIKKPLALTRKCVRNDYPLIFSRKGGGRKRYEQGKSMVCKADNSLCFSL